MPAPRARRSSETFRWIFAITLALFGSLYCTRTCYPSLLSSPALRPLRLTSAARAAVDAVLVVDILVDVLLPFPVLSTYFQLTVSCSPPPISSREVIDAIAACAASKEFIQISGGRWLYWVSFAVIVLVTHYCKFTPPPTPVPWWNRPLRFRS